jgi:hypothetical protein
VNFKKLVDKSKENGGYILKNEWVNYEKLEGKSRKIGG